MEKIRAVVFDLDGTLLDTLEDLRSNLNRVLGKRGLPVHSSQDYKKFVGRGLRVLVENATKGLALSVEDFESLLKEFQQEYKNHPADHTKPYLQVEEMLSSLQERVSMFILSNKEHSMTLHVVQALLGQFQFDEIHGMKPGIPGKPDPHVLVELLKSYGLKPGEVLYLGDSDVDMQTARGAGVEACGALWGFRDRSELEGAGAHRVFESPLGFLEYAMKRIEKE